MKTLTQINTRFCDTNGDSIAVKLATKPFVTGNIDDVVNWMVKYQYANVNMEDYNTGDTFFFLACLNNPNDDLIKWLIETNEVDPNYENYLGQNVIDFLCANYANSTTSTNVTTGTHNEFIENRIKLLLSLYNFDFNKVNYSGQTKFEQICLTGNSNIVRHLVESNLVNIDINMYSTIRKKLSTIIRDLTTQDQSTADHSNLITTSTNLHLIINYLDSYAKQFNFVNT